jgi:putative addiction module component (TIGR02574 family)
MGKAEILAQLPHLSLEDRAEVQAKLDELAADAWLDQSELTSSARQELDATLTAYEKSPDAGRSWEQVKARVQAKLNE